MIILKNEHVNHCISVKLFYINVIPKIYKFLFAYKVKKKFKKNNSMWNSCFSNYADLFVKNK